jgi:hypothetical protein
MLKRPAILGFLEAYAIAMRLMLVLLAGLFTLIYCPPLKAFVVSMVIQTNPKPLWGPTQTWRTGATNGLDGTASTGNTGYTWSCTAYDDGTGPASCSFLNFSSTSASQPTVTGTTGKVGDYAIQLCDGAGMNCVTTHIGAVDFDATTGIVNTHSAIADKFLLPMQAIGHNPWGFEDERATTMMGLQWTAINTAYPYNSYTEYDPSWAHDQTGTVSFVWNGKGNAVGAAGTTLHTGITATSLSMDVDDVSVLDLGGLTGSCGSTIRRITIQQPPFYNQEEVKVCATTGTTGRQTLTVPYDGRGIGSGPLGSQYVVPAQIWNANAVVGQSLTKGSGTSFLTTLAPGGAGFAGPVVYSTNTVTVTTGMPTIVGNTTNWTTQSPTCFGTGATICPGYVIQIYATHGGGTPFTFASFINSIDSTTGITLARNYPSDADSGTFSYKIIIPFYRWIVSHYTRGAPYSGDALVDWGTTTCDDDTYCYFGFVGIIGHDAGVLNGTTVSGKNYSYIDNASSDWPFNFGFYSPSLAYRSMWYRAGIVQYLQMANTIDDLYPRWPGFADGAPGYGNTLYIGAGAISSSLSFVLRGSPSETDMRPWWNTSLALSAPGTGPGGIGGVPACGGEDTRTQGYQEGFTFQGALYDPDTTSPDGPGGVPWRTVFRNKMATINTWDNTCARANGGVDTNSWANNAAWNFGTPVTLTNGSPIGTGTGIPSSACNGIEQGTLQVTAGSSAVTANMGSSFDAATTDIVISGRSYGFHRSTSTSGNIAVLWPGSTDMAAPYMTVNNTGYVSGYMAAYGTSQEDDALKTNYACIWNNSGQITLSANFVGNVSPTTYYQFNANAQEALAGYAQQPFYIGIKGYGTNQASTLDSTLGLNNATIRNNGATWIYTYGFQTGASDPGINAIYWARICSFCESGGTIDGTFQFTTPASRIGSENAVSREVSAERELNQEGFNALVWYYINNATAPVKAVVDTLYGALWGSDTLDDSSIHAYTDAASLGNIPGFLNLSDASLAAGKYPGQYFGMGMAHVWPALRECQVVGGVVPVTNGVIDCLASNTSGGSATGGKSVMGGNAVRF